MTGGGLREVANPSELFLSERDRGTPGTAVFAGIEGTRPLLVEMQALVAPSSLGTPRRAVVGWDPSRLSMVLAVLEAHCGVKLGGYDVYLNVAGGMRIVEPAADLAAVAALVSSLTNASLPPDAVYFGEISLSGVVRPVAQASARLKEAQKLGFARAVIPDSAKSDAADSGLSITAVAALQTLVADIAARGTEQNRPAGRGAPSGARGIVPDGGKKPGQQALQATSLGVTWPDCPAIHPRIGGGCPLQDWFWTTQKTLILALAGKQSVGSGWVEKSRRFGPARLARKDWLQGFAV